jgi:molybdopterin-guanine dinucleotide biosynthesis protein A
MIAGVILAGGRSSRMGGRDKALIELAGRTLLEHSLDRLAPQVGSLAISSNADLAGHARGLPVLPDLFAGFQGPLAGIHAGLVWAAGQRGIDYVVTVAVDTPFFPYDLAEKLFRDISVTSSRIAIARTNADVHPTFGMWPIDILEDIGRCLAVSQNRSVLSFVETRDHVKVGFPRELSFLNINSPDDIRVAELVCAEGEQDGREAGEGPT